MVEIRTLLPADLDVIAELHTRSWRSAYRGILRDEYLDGAIKDERLAVWRARMHAPVPGQVGLLATRDQIPIGFAFAYCAHHPRWGTLLDNLHVDPEGRGKGIGTMLLHALMKGLSQTDGMQGVYLWIFEGNHRTRKYYERLGAATVERAVIAAPGGGEVAEWLYAWPTAHALCVATEG